MSATPAGSWIIGSGPAVPRAPFLYANLVVQPISSSVHLLFSRIILLDIQQLCLIIRVYCKMSLRQSSLKDFFPAIARKGCSIGGHQGNFSKQLQRSTEACPQRRRVSHRVSRSIKVNACKTLSTDDECFADDEADTGGSDNDTPSIVSHHNSLTADTARDTDTDDESFAVDEVDTTGTEEDNSTAEDENETALSLASSSAIQPTTLPLETGPTSRVVTHAGQYEYVSQSQAERCPIIHKDVTQLPGELKNSLPWVPLESKATAPRRRKAEKITIYEDDTATPSGWFEAGSTGGDQIPAVDHRVLTPLGYGQENRRPVHAAVEAGVEIAAFLDEDDGSEEEMDRMQAVEVLNSWPF